MRTILILLVNFYKKFISPLFPPTCRYYPSCSTYMITALQKHGVILGLIMGISRIIRCNPFIKGDMIQYLISFQFIEISEQEINIVAQLT